MNPDLHLAYTLIEDGKSFLYPLGALILLIIVGFVGKILGWWK